MQGELWKQAGRDLLATMREASGKAHDAAEFIGTSRLKLGSEYFEPAASETERTARDLAIAQHYLAAGQVDRTLFRRRTDPPLLAALTRVPRILLDLTDAELDELRSEYIAHYFPHTTAAFVALEDCLAAPR